MNSRNRVHHSFRPFTNALRKQGGWKKRFTTVADGERITVYEKRVSNRVLDLQLYGRGQHRVSHFLDGRMSTYPTDFLTVEEMLEAIEKELNRKDHPPR